MHIASIIRHLADLWRSDDPPTQEAFDKTVRFLVGAAIKTRSQEIPACCVTMDSESGVRIEWIRSSANVHLVVPAVRMAYIYHEIDNVYATEDATPEGLAYWLHKLKENQ